MTARYQARTAIVAVVLAGLAVGWDAAPASAQFTYTRAAGPETAQTASLNPPAGLVASSPTCSSSADYEDTVVPLSWAGSSSTDADGNYLISYYGVWRSAQGAPFSLSGSLSGAPPADSLGDNTASLPGTAYVGIADGFFGTYYDGDIDVLGSFGSGGEENSVAGTPDGTRAFMAESANGAGKVIQVGAQGGSASFDQVEATITLAGANPDPIAVAVAPNDNDLYVLDKANDRVDVVPLPITSSTYSVPASATLPSGTVADPAAMTLTPASSELLVADYSSGALTIINTATASVAAAVTLARPSGGATPAPSAIVVSPSGAFAYVLDSANSQVDVVALTGARANQETAEVNVASQAGAPETPADMDIASNATNGPEIYVAGPGSSSVSEINAGTLQVTNIPLGTGADPAALAAAANGCYVAVAETVSGVQDAAIINATTNTLALTEGASTFTGGTATTIAITDNGSSFQENVGPLVVMPMQLSYELQSGSSSTGFKSALSAPVALTLGRGQLP